MSASVIGVGTDIVLISRMRKAIARWADRLALRILSADEWAYCRTRRDAAPHVAARFAAKEAGLKALGLGWMGTSWTDLEVVRALSGQPSLQLTGRAARRMTELGGDAVFVSLTHDGDYAAAHVVVGRTVDARLAGGAA
jgi:holo-[acyl-carrier protein] synthase